MSATMPTAAAVIRLGQLSLAFGRTIADYELRRTPEARYVKALDKLLPKITHLLNDCATMREQGMVPVALAARYDTQLDELLDYASDFPPLFELRAELVDLVMERFTQVEAR